MPTDPQTVTTRKTPTLTDSAIFRSKTFLLQLRRAVQNLTSDRVPRHPKGAVRADAPVVGNSVTPLWTEAAIEERMLVAGKIHNLRLAVRKLDGLEVPAGQVFSFWKQVGRTSRFKGFVTGRELREGCIIPNIGGGLCQLSNALYDAALQAGFEILERHAHTQVISGSLAEKGRDATVFWNYVDLRFRSAESFRIEARLTTDELVVRFRGKRSAQLPVTQIHRTPLSTTDPNSCATCEVGDCHRVVLDKRYSHGGYTAYLVDEFSPEFDSYIQSSRTANDRLLLPLDGARLRKSNYAWTTSGFQSVRQSLLTTMKRSYSSRRLAAQGAARQLNLLRTYEALAESYAKHLTHDVTHLVVQQNLLPFLWMNGHLGGRTYDVLMSALPMYEIQNRLDAAHKLHPESTTLGDFRADQILIDAERAALDGARHVITPHSDIARLYSQQAKKLDWHASPRSRTAIRREKPVVVFPATTVGRKGCYELRDALRDLNIKLIVIGPLIEDAQFWDGFDIERGADDWLERADLVVLPAFVEHRPRRLLLAAASGIPVIATPACGVEDVENVVTTTVGDAASLRRSIIEHLPVR